MKGLLERAKKQLNNFKKIKKGTRAKIISGIMLGIILIAAALLFLMFENNKDKQLLKNITDPELARAMTYDVVEPGDEIVDEAQNVRFDAFFLRDLNGDGYAESIRGTCKEIGQEDTLYMELNVITAGYLKDAKIEINGDNFYMQTALPKDDELKDNYIGNNVRVIEFNDITLDNILYYLKLKNMENIDISNYDYRKFGFRGLDKFLEKENIKIK